MTAVTAIDFAAQRAAELRREACAARRRWAAHSRDRAELREEPQERIRQAA